MNIVTRFGLWLVRVGNDTDVSPEMQAALIATRGSLNDIERVSRKARERLALAIIDAKAANILHTTTDPDEEQV